MTPDKLFSYCVAASFGIVFGAGLALNLVVFIAALMGIRWGERGER